MAIAKQRFPMNSRFVASEGQWRQWRATQKGMHLHEAPQTPSTALKERKTPNTIQAHKQGMRSYSAKQGRGSGFESGFAMLEKVPAESYLRMATGKAGVLGMAGACALEIRGCSSHIWMVPNRFSASH